MFNLQLTKINSDKLKQIIDIFHSLKVEHIYLTISMTDITITGIDQTKTSILFLTLPRQFFHSYNVIKPTQAIILVELLQTFLKSLTKNIQLIISQDNDTHIKLIFENKEIKQTFKIPLLDIEFENLDKIANNITYLTKYQIKSDCFKNIINNISLIEAEDLTINIDNQNVIFNAKGDLGEINTQFNTTLITDYLNKDKDKDKDKDNDKDISCLSYQNLEFKIKETFSLEMIKKCAKQTSFCDFGPIISLNHDIPIQIEYIIKPVGNLKIYIAPKIVD
jgi:proliferating cell nuclear antigen PCNA